MLFRKPHKKKLRQTKFVSEWRELQSFCRDKRTWPDALIAADKLLDKVLKKKRFKGKTMGERLVAAQRMFRDNDDIWDAHKLTVKITESGNQVKLREAIVKETLISYREALCDLGALPRSNSAGAEASK